MEINNIVLTLKYHKGKLLSELFQNNQYKFQ